MYKIKVGAKAKDEIVIKANMPGAVDFEKGIVKVDYQLWPFFQAIDLDHILVCIEVGRLTIYSYGCWLQVAMSQTGRVIFTSKHTHMLSIVVNTLRYVLDMRNWDGITIPIIHAVSHMQRAFADNQRDTSFIVEDPGPYLIGLPTELKGLVSIPAEVVMIDVDTK
jgi:nicotinamide N-methyltransferase